MRHTIAAGTPDVQPTVSTLMENKTSWIPGLTAPADLGGVAGGGRLRHSEGARRLGLLHVHHIDVRLVHRLRPTGEGSLPNHHVQERCLIDSCHVQHDDLGAPNMGQRTDHILQNLLRLGSACTAP